MSKIVEEAKQKISTRNINNIKEVMERFNKEWQPIITKLYPQQEPKMDPNQNPFTSAEGFDPSMFTNVK